MARGNYDNVGVHELRDVAASEMGHFDPRGVDGGSRRRQVTRDEPSFKYRFENFFHPYVEELIQRLNRTSLRGMLDPKFHADLRDTDFFGENYYTPQNSTWFANTHEHARELVVVESRPKEIDLEVGGPYANYNWELLFHLPLAMAVHLSKTQHFAEAQRCFHFIFDPTCTDAEPPPPDRYWKFLAFREDDDLTRIDRLLELLSREEDEPNDRKAQILAGYEEILKKPFRPHAVARTRLLSYKYCVVMKYLNNLIAWGDHLFRQDTIETINEATQIYVLAANILGHRPQRIPRPGSSRPKTFAELKSAGLDRMSNTLVDLEGHFPHNLGLPHDAPDDAAGPLFGIGPTLYFCIPHNEKMLGYWDTVADRLFKVRNCTSIEGVVRQLALFEPPIDPGMLVKAAAAGIDVGTIVSGLNRPAGPVRALLLIQKAQELCAEVRNLGGALLSAIEKGDGERLALLRQGHEIKIQQMAQDVRFLQWKQAENGTGSLLKTRASALERFNYYQRLLGMASTDDAPSEELPLDRRTLTEENFDEAYATLVGQYDTAVPTQDYARLSLAGGSSPANQSGATGEGRLYLNSNEAQELNEHLPAARDLRHDSSIADAIASVLVNLPDININLQYWGLGVSSKVFGGDVMAEAAKLAAQLMRTDAAWQTDQAGIVSRTAGYERRGDDWILQSNLAARELMQIGRQILGSLIAEQVAHREYLNTKQQIENSQEVDRLLRDKFTNEELYAWMQGEISRLYYEYYRFAFDTARQAEQSMKRELMRPEVDETDYIKFNYWDDGRRGLLSGEALYLDVKRMEMAYHLSNKREYELTKHISLRQLDPVALLTLKATGTCQVTVPEWVCDLDAPGHYMRRIKSVSLSIPAVTGPHTGVHCTLTLLRSSLRKSPQLKDGAYARQGSEDDRFSDFFGAVQSIVTSGAINDSGMFETNLRDERILPFEGAGVESTWKLELPAAYRSFDYDTISDVILHLRFTARQGGALLTEGAEVHVGTVVEAYSSGLTLMMSLKHDFPTEWSRFHTAGGSFTAKLERSFFPYFTQGRTVTITEIRVDAIASGALGSVVPADLDLTALTDGLAAGSQTVDVELPRTAVLQAGADKNVFVLIKYSI